MGTLVLACLPSLANPIIVPTGVDSTRGGSVWIKENGTDVNAYFAGVIFISLTQNGTVYHRDTLCVDLFTDINLGVTYDTTVLSPAAVPGKNMLRVSWLVDNALLPTERAGEVSNLAESDWVRTVAQGIGIQLAVWDIVHDGGDGFNSGSVQSAALTNATVLYWANQYLTLSSGKTSALAYVYENFSPGTTNEAQMLAGPRFFDGGPRPAPEPATMVMVGTVLIGLGVLIRRRRGGNGPGSL